jgi:hypothetical protein
VKQLRAWLLLLLILLLPIRGAMAAAMLCLPQDGPQNVMPQHLGGEQSGHDHTHHGPVAQVHADAVETGQDGGQVALDSENCNLCASFCSLTPLASTVPDLRHPCARAALNPAPSVPAPSFVSDGEERPPRTI